MVSSPHPPTTPPTQAPAPPATPPAAPPATSLEQPQAEPVFAHDAAWALARRQWARGAPLPWLHQEVARRMAERLSVIRMQPSVVLEWGALPGQSRAALEAAYPAARWTPVGPAGPTGPNGLVGPSGLMGLTRPAGPAQRQPPLPVAAPPSLLERLVPLRTWAQGLFKGAPTQAAALGFAEDEVPPGHGQLLWSNLGLHTYGPAAQVLRRWHAALAVDGFLMFSTFGPDTLREWRSLWEEAGWGPPAQAFRDMHDWGDDLVAAGFADPVMDQETLTLTWASAEAALAELRTLGRNAHPGRHPGCRTPRWRARLCEALERRAGPDGRIALSFEIIYGHAFRPAPRSRLQPTTTVSLEDMRHMVKTARRPL